MATKKEKEPAGIPAEIKGRGGKGGGGAAESEGERNRADQGEGGALRPYIRKGRRPWR